MSQSVQKILKVYHDLDTRDDDTHIPVFVKEDLAALKNNPAFRELVSMMHSEIQEADAEMHGHVEKAEWDQAARENGRQAGLVWPLLRMLEMDRYFKLKEDPDYEEEED